MPKRNPDHMTAQRERILRATIRCISEVGLERTSVARICRESGLSAGAIYTHFSGKEAIVAEALRHAAMTDAMLPDSWAALMAALAAPADQMDHDAATVVRARLQLFTSSVRPGPLHDMLKPQLEQTLALVADHLIGLQQAGQIRLRLTPMQTAMCLSALADGLMWIGLARDRTPAEIAEDVVAGLQCLVTLPN